METLQYMQELDTPSNMRAIISKLPFKLSEQWRTTAHGILETHKRRALFQDLVLYIKRHVKILSDPLFGDIKDTPTGNSLLRSVNRTKSQPESKFKGNSFATTVAPVSSAEKPGEKPAMITTHPCSLKGKLTCVCCAQSHSLDDCQQFKRKKHRDKISLLKEKKLCFGCLHTGHMSRDCFKCLTCKSCGETHPSSLHIDKGDNVDTDTELSKRHIATNTSASHETCGHTGAGRECCFLSILSVKVKSVKGNWIVQTYAFLDSGSTATFCSERLMRRLEEVGWKKDSVFAADNGTGKNCSIL